MKKKIYLLCSIIVLLSFFSTNFVFASENENFSQENANVFIENLLLENKDFSIFNNFKITEKLNLTNVEYKLPRITLYRFKTDSDNGYLIELNGEVIEFAPTNDPFEFFEQSDFYVESGKPYYTRKYHSYLCVAQIGNVDHYLDSNGNVLQTSSTISFANDSYSSTANVTIPVPIMMQGSSNCVDNATATLLYYWDRNYSNLVYNFYSTRDDIKSRRVNQQGNDYLTSVVKEYALSRGYFIQPSSKWNPTWSDYSSKINSGRPVLLGFASGYSAPHMTVGCGTFNFSGINYAVVVDGHNSTRVNKKWSSANDFILDAGFTP